jgi:hypothetical protein
MSAEDRRPPQILPHAQRGGGGRGRSPRTVGAWAWARIAVRVEVARGRDRPPPSAKTPTPPPLARGRSEERGGEERGAEEERRRPTAHPDPPPRAAWGRWTRAQSADGGGGAGARSAVPVEVARGREACPLRLHAQRAATSPAGAGEERDTRGEAWHEGVIGTTAYLQAPTVGEDADTSPAGAGEERRARGGAGSAGGSGVRGGRRKATRPAWSTVVTRLFHAGPSLDGPGSRACDPDRLVRHWTY